MRNTSRIVLLLAMLSLYLVAQAQQSRYERARSIANSFFEQKFGVASIGIQKSRMAFDSRMLQNNVADEPTFYLIAAPTDKGFVIVSGDDIAMPLIGFSDEHIPASIEEIPDGMRDYLLDIDAQIRAARNSSQKNVNKAPVDASQVGNIVVNRL